MKYWDFTIYYFTLLYRCIELFWSIKTACMKGNFKIANRKLVFKKFLIYFTNASEKKSFSKISWYWYQKIPLEILSFKNSEHPIIKNRIRGKKTHTWDTKFIQKFVSPCIKQFWQYRNKNKRESFITNTAMFYEEFFLLVDFYAKYRLRSQF